MAGEKTCFKCLCKKPTSEFYAHKMMADGHLNKCKDCTKRDVKRHRIENIESARAYDRMRSSMPHRVSKRTEYGKTEAGRLSAAASKRKYELVYKDRKTANTAVNNAVRRGLIEKWPACAVPDCTSQKTEAHHPDYSNPLGVVWLCKKHHMDAHKMSRGH